MQTLETSFSRERCFKGFTQDAFWAIQEEGNEIQVPGDRYKRHFLDLTIVEFWACQEAEIDF